jgi:CRISPR type I-E-associated protein CasB/Cse2
VNGLAATPTAADGPEERSWASKVAGIAEFITALPRGDKAELRRMVTTRQGQPGPVFWRIAAKYDIRAYEEEFWMTLAVLMTRHEHRMGARVGRVLRNEGVSQARIRRWLSLDRGRAIQEVGRLLQQVQTAIDWVQMASLLRSWTDEDRRRFARDYFIVPAVAGTHT